MYRRVAAYGKVSGIIIVQALLVGVSRYALHWWL
jgi:hypothetical protein